MPSNPSNQAKQLTEIPACRDSTCHGLRQESPTRARRRHPADRLAVTCSWRWHRTGGVVVVVRGVLREKVAIARSSVGRAEEARQHCRTAAAALASAGHRGRAGGSFPRSMRGEGRPGPDVAYLADADRGPLRRMHQRIKMSLAAWVRVPPTTRRPRRPACRSVVRREDRGVCLPSPGGRSGRRGPSRRPVARQESSSGLDAPTPTTPRATSTIRKRSSRKRRTVRQVDRGSLHHRSPTPSMSWAWLTRSAR